MFEVFPGTLEYPCLHHRGYNASHLCSDSSCSSHPFLCQSCLSDHSKIGAHAGHEETIVPIAEAVSSLAQSIDQKRSDIDKINRAVLNKVDVEGMTKKLEDGDQTYKVMETHLKSLKVQVEKDADSLVAEFQRKVMLNKQSLLNQLDNYQRNYIQNMETFRETVEPLSMFKRNIRFYSNPNNIYLKLHSELKRKSAEWYLQTKRVISQIYRVSDRVHTLGDNLAKASQLVSNPDQLPFIKPIEFNESVKMRLQYFVNEYMNDKLVMRDAKEVGNMGNGMGQEEPRNNNSYKVVQRYY